MTRRIAFSISIMLVLTAFSLTPTLSRNSFTTYDDVEPVLNLLTDVLPTELKAAPLSDPRKAWSDWILSHDADIRKRLVRGDEDTIVNWLLFGTSFTRQPMALFEVPATSDRWPAFISQRIKDLISAVRSSNTDERRTFARRFLGSQAYGFDSAEDRAKLERHLHSEVDRVLAERQQYANREESFRAGDTIEQIMVQSTLFRDRGLSLDTSILSSFAIDQALNAMKAQQFLAPGNVRRVAVIGPGLDFADKSSGYDFYPVQTLQPLSTIDSLLRLGLITDAAELEITTLDISARVNDHIQSMRDRARTRRQYTVRLPTDLASIWTPALSSYWKSVLGRIGSEKSIAAPPGVGKGIQLRTVEVRSGVAARVTPVDFNVVTEKWTGPPFDLVIATNVLVYYDKLDQALAFSAIETMLRPGGFFLTNNAVVELPTSRLRSAGVVTVKHSLDKVDHVFWYRRN
jgi:hypothetical protein